MAWERLGQRAESKVSGRQGARAGGLGQDRARGRRHRRRGWRQEVETGTRARLRSHPCAFCRLSTVFSAWSRETCREEWSRELLSSRVYRGKHWPRAALRDGSAAGLGHRLCLRQCGHVLPPRPPAQPVTSFLSRAQCPAGPLTTVRKTQQPQCLNFLGFPSPRPFTSSSRSPSRENACTESLA